MASHNAKENNQQEHAVAMFTGASNFQIDHSTFNAASVINITQINANDTPNTPPGYTEGMTHCPSSTLFFTGRSNILAIIQDFYKQDSVNEERRLKIFLLYGLGGAGKTQSALEFIRISKKRFTKIYFIDAHSEDSIKASYYDIALSNSSRLPQGWESGLKWLTSQGEEWLLFFDNADDPTINLGYFLPSCDHGNIIITSRNSGLLNIASQSQEVKDMEPKDATQLLLKYAVRHQATLDEITTAANIAEELHYFALALVQAGAYINQQNCLNSYLKRLKSQRIKLLGRDIAQNLNYRLSIFSTWKLSWRELDEDSRLFLNMCSYLHYEGVPRTLFERAFKNIDNIEQSMGPSDAIRKAKPLTGIFSGQNMEWDDIKMDDMIQKITSYSLLNIVSDGVYQIHPLVHTWIYESMEERLKEDIRLGIQGIFIASISGTTVGDIAYLRVVAQSFKSLLGNADISDTLDTLVKVNIGDLWLKTGFAARAVNCWEPIFADMCELLGQEHPMILTYKARLALAYCDMGRYNEALLLQGPLISTSQKVLGLDHRDILQYTSDMANVYKKLGRYDEALKLQIPIFEIASRVLGKEHPDTLACINQVTSLYWHTSKYDEALQLQEPLIETAKRVLGQEHPNTLIYTDDLALIYVNQGKYNKAIEVRVPLLEMSTRIFGRDHQETLKRTCNLAVTYRRLGQYSEALKLLEPLVETSKQVLGDGHPETSGYISNLALVYQRSGKYREAVGLLEPLVETSKRDLGPNHPNTLVRINNLALTYRNLGKYSQALHLQTSLLETSKCVRGKQHQETLTHMNNLAVTYQKLGEFDRALELQELLLNTSKQVLGEENPDTLKYTIDLASTYRQLGKYKESLQLESLLLKVQHVLGDEHPHTLACVDALALTYQDMDKCAEALALQQNLLEMSKQVLGKDHPDTLSYTHNLSLTYQRLGQYHQALTLQEPLVEALSQILGEEHPNTLSSKKMLDLTYSALIKKNEEKNSWLNRCVLQ